MTPSKFNLEQLGRLLTKEPKAFFKNVPFNAVSVDSRTLKAGELFFALPGQQVDGHDFLKIVEAKNACAAVVSHEFYNQHCDKFSIPLLPVTDTLFALQQFAKEWLKKSGTKVIAITGSVGKTTVKHLLNTLLQKKFSVTCSKGNQNSQIGLPLSILNELQGDENFLILEMGMTQQGHIQKLTLIAPPHIALLTAIEWVHGNGISSLEDIAKAKMEIFTHPTTSLGILPLNIAYKELVSQSGNCSKKYFSTQSPDANYFMQENEQGICIYDHKNCSPLLACPPLIGKHNLHNFLAAVSVCRYLGMEWDLIQQTIPTLTLPERRLEQVSKKGILFINDSYNAALVSVKAALDSLPHPKNGRKKIAILGELAELGINSDAIYREIGSYSLTKVDEMICFGNHCCLIEEIWKQENKPVSLFTDFEKVVEQLQRSSSPGDVVLLKGSNTKKLWEILNYF